MKKIFWGVFLFFIFGNIVKATDLTCYYQQENNGQYNIIVEVNKNGTISAKVDSDNVGAPKVNVSNITFKELLKNNETILSCPNSLYTAIPGFPANTYDIYFQYDSRVFGNDKCDNLVNCYLGTLDTNRSTQDITLEEETEATMNCEYNSNGSLVGTNNARILYSVVGGNPFFTLKSNDITYTLEATEGFSMASSCEEQGNLYIQCHYGNNHCAIGDSRNSKFPYSTILHPIYEITLVSEEDETIKDGDEIAEEDESHLPGKNHGFNPSQVCKDEENCDINLNGFCGEPTVSRVLKFIGLIIFIAKILVPAIIIIMGFVTLFKIMTSGKVDEAKKQVNNIIRNIVIGVLIFLLPSLINLVFEMADDIISPGETSDFSNCVNCLTTPNDSSKCIIDESDD